MASVLRVSDAASMGLHAMVLLAAEPDRLHSTHRVAARLRVSAAHLSKVLQRLARAGLVTATRGPRGGYGIRPGGGRMPLLRIYEALEGRLNPTNCLLATPLCGGRRCIFGDLLKKLNREVRQHLAKTTLSDAVQVYRGRK